MINQQKNVRVDKWLWAARFYKTRQLAVKAIKNGQIYVNEQRVKPASNVHTKDVLAITKGIHKMEIQILEISDQRGPANIAQSLYKETPQSIEKREVLKQQLAAQPKVVVAKRKPDKRGVRSNRQLKRGD